MKLNAIITRLCMSFLCQVSLFLTGLVFGESDELAWRELEASVSKSEALNQAANETEQKFKKLVETKNAANLIHNTINSEVFKPSKTFVVDKFEGPQTLENVEKYYRHQLEREIVRIEEEQRWTVDLRAHFRQGDPELRNTNIEKWRRELSSLVGQINKDNTRMAQSKKFSCRDDLVFARVQGQMRAVNVLASLDKIDTRQHDLQIRFNFDLATTDGNNRTKLEDFRERLSLLPSMKDYYNKPNEELGKILDDLDLRVIPGLEKELRGTIENWQKQWRENDCNGFYEGLDSRILAALIVRHDVRVGEHSVVTQPASSTNSRYILVTPRVTYEIDCSKKNRR